MTNRPAFVEQLSKYSWCCESTTYGSDHLRDHVGRSFSSISVYTERVEDVPTASRPDTGEKPSDERQRRTLPDLQSTVVIYLPSGKFREEYTRQVSLCTPDRDHEARREPIDATI